VSSDHGARALVGARADHRGRAPERVRAQRREHRVDGLRCHADHRLALVRDDQRVDAEQLAGRAHRVAHRDRAARRRTMPTRLLSAISWSALASPPRVGSFIATMPAPSTASAARTSPLIGATSERQLALERERLAGGHHRQSVIADGAGHDQAVAGAPARSRGRCVA
jgi:hypothetical protein